MDRALLIFIKNPELGKAKTRLAATIGDEKALEVYKQLLNHTRITVKQVNANRQVHYSSFIDDNDEWNTGFFERKLQNQSLDLGVRMASAFTSAFAEGNSSVLIIGSDLPHLSAELIEEGFDQLQKNDVVIGPSDDGGYYLLGMNSMHNTLFENKKWSTNSVLKETIESVEELNLGYHLLPSLFDVDTEADLERALETEAPAFS